MNRSQNIEIYGRLRQGAKVQEQSSSKIGIMVSGNKSRAYPGKSESLRNKQIHRTTTKTCEPINQKQIQSSISLKMGTSPKTNQRKATYPHTTQDVKGDDIHIRRPKR